MKKLALSVIATAVVAAACATKHEPTTTTAPAPAAVPDPGPAGATDKPTIIEGKWSGRESGPNRDGDISLTLKGSSFDFRAESQDAWARGTFALDGNANPKRFIGVIKESGASEAVDKKVYAIYKIEDGKLIIVANDVGREEYPESFDALGCTKDVLTRDK